MLFTEKGTLPDGVEFEGKTHREFELREQLVKDTVEFIENGDPSDIARAQLSASFAKIAICTRRLKIGDIPADQLKSAMIMELNQDDMNEINAADIRLQNRRAAFRKEHEKPSIEGAGTDETGLQREPDKRDA
jgi:hypothetical protein